MDLETTEHDRYPAKKARKSKHLGQLNSLLIRGLPDWVNEEGVLRTYDLAETLNVSYQAAYKWWDRNRLPARRIAALVRLSNETTNRPEGFQPLTFEDFAEFI